jgi:hypothetical protein
MSRNLQMDLQQEKLRNAASSIDSETHTWEAEQSGRASELRQSVPYIAETLLSLVMFRGVSLLCDGSPLHWPSSEIHAKLHVDATQLDVVQEVQPTTLTLTCPVGPLMTRLAAEEADRKNNGMTAQHESTPNSIVHFREKNAGEEEIIQFRNTEAIQKPPDGNHMCGVFVPAIWLTFCPTFQRITHFDHNTFAQVSSHVKVAV